MKSIAILGATGSVGRQALEVIQANTDRFRAAVLTAGSNATDLVALAREFRPDAVVIADVSRYETVKDGLKNTGIAVHAGKEALSEVVAAPEVDLVLTALVGYCGLKPTLAAVQAGKDIALANKETLVVAGDLITREASKNKVTLLPVDSEHSAIFQCLTGEAENPLEKIYLTASGGPFRGKKAAELAHVTREQALKHPNWSMGAKITIDSASLMNKGLEVIEASWLFDLKPQQIDVVVHPQSVIHSITQFEDGSMKAQMGLPDMKLPIQYAMAWPKRLKNDFPRLDFSRMAELSFEAPDRETFRNLDLAYQALEQGGNMPCVLNAANEVVVQAFLEERIGFLDMPGIIAACMEKVSFLPQPNYEDYVLTDEETRRLALSLLADSKVLYQK